MTYIKVTELQRKYLVTQGGRTPADVIEKQGKLYIPMGDGKGGIELVDLPSDEAIKSFYKLKDTGKQILLGYNATKFV